MGIETFVRVQDGAPLAPVVAEDDLFAGLR